jgi:hypothetical protein
MRQNDSVTVGGFGKMQIAADFGVDGAVGELANGG